MSSLLPLINNQNRFGSVSFFSGLHLCVFVVFVLIYLYKGVLVIIYTYYGITYYALEMWDVSAAVMYRV